VYRVILQNTFSVLENLLSKDAERLVQRVLGITKLKYCWQVLKKSILLVLNSFMKKTVESKIKRRQVWFYKRAGLLYRIALHYKALFCLLILGVNGIVWQCCTDVLSYTDF